MVGRYLEALIDRFDSEWIGQVAQSRAAIHEARQVTLAEIKSPNQKPLQAKNIRAVRGLHDMIERALQASEVASPATLMGLIKNEIMTKAEHFKEASREIDIALDAISDLDMTLNTSIAFIVKEQIKNYYNAKDSRNRLFIGFHPSQKNGPNRGTLYIATKIRPKGKVVVDKLALLPLKFDGRNHYGAYLSGILVRALGGWVHVETSSKNPQSPIFLTIRIPILGKG
jgi:hypothetical protein